MRGLLPLLLAFPLAAQEPDLSPFAREKARTLLKQQTACLGCHELDGDGGRSAPSLTTVGERRNASYIRAIIEDPQRIVPGSAMPRAEMPRATRELVIRYLARNAAPGPQPQAPIVPRDGRAVPASVLYNRWCASCHGQNGNGDGPNARYLPVPPAVHHDSARMAARSDDALFDAIAGGGAVMGKSPRMPAFGATLTSAEIRSLVAYMRTLCACAGPAWSRDGGRRGSLP